AARPTTASQLIGRLAPAPVAARRAADGEGPLSRYGGDMVGPEQTHMEIAVLKRLAAAYVMSSASQQPVYEAQEETIRDLYSRLWNTGTQYLGPLFTELSHSASDDAGRRRGVVDQRASYADVTARRLHEVLFGRSVTHVTAADTPLPGLGPELGAHGPRTDPSRRRGLRAGALAPGRGGLRARHAALGRDRVDEGPVPLPRREDPLVQHPPAARPLALLRLRRGRGRDLVRPEDQPPQLRRGGRDARRPLRRPAAVRGRRRGARRPP